MRQVHLPALGPAATAVTANGWITVMRVRAAGTDPGDPSAHELGLGWSTLASLLVFCAATGGRRSRVPAMADTGRA